MNGLPSGIDIVKQIPLHLIDGWRSGEYWVDGGTLRRMNGTFAGFLTEGPGLVRHVQQGLPIQPAQLMQAVGNAKLAAQLATGIGVLNLGVQVAGFSMVAQRLDGITRQIEAVRDELQTVGEDVGWLKAFVLAGLRADVGNAIADGERAARQGNAALFNDAKGKADHARRHTVELMREMVAHRRLVAQHRIFSELLNMAVVLAATEARCTLAVESAELAATDLVEAVAELRMLADQFRAFGTDFQKAPRDHLRLGQDGRSRMLAAVGAAGTLVGRLRGHATQLRLQSLLGLDADAWQKATSLEGDGAISYIKFVGDEGEALAEHLTELDRDPVTQGAG